MKPIYLMDNIPVQSGIKIECRISGVVIKDAILTLQQNRWYICQNHLNGSTCNNKYGYIYSYDIGARVKNSPFDLQSPLLEMKVNDPLKVTEGAINTVQLSNGKLMTYTYSIHKDLEIYRIKILKSRSLGPYIKIKFTRAEAAQLLLKSLRTLY